MEFSRGVSLTKAIFYKIKQRNSHRDTSEKVCLKKHGVSNNLGRGGGQKIPQFWEFWKFDIIFIIGTGKSTKIWNFMKIGQKTKKTPIFGVAHCQLYPPNLKNKLWKPNFENFTIINITFSLCMQNFKSVALMNFVYLQYQTGILNILFIYW